MAFVAESLSSEDGPPAAGTTRSVNLVSPQNMVTEETATSWTGICPGDDVSSSSAIREIFQIQPDVQMNGIIQKAQCAVNYLAWYIYRLRMNAAFYLTAGEKFNK